MTNLLPGVDPNFIETEEERDVASIALHEFETKYSMPIYHGRYRHEVDVALHISDKITRQQLAVHN